MRIAAEEAVACEERAQPWEVGEARVRRQYEDERRRHLRHDEHDPIARKVADQEAEDRLLVVRVGDDAEGRKQYAIPRKRIAKTMAAHVSVVRAFFHSGGLNAGTPSLMASTPVSATAPWLKARKIRKRPSAWPPCSTDAHEVGGKTSGARRT